MVRTGLILFGFYGVASGLFSVVTLVVTFCVKVTTEKHVENDAVCLCLW